jgi:hypothetical protein
MADKKEGVDVGGPRFGLLGGMLDLDEKIAKLFKQWLAAFEAAEAGTGEEEAVAAREVLADIESRIAATPAEGLRGLVVKLGLHQFLNDQADAASVQVTSVYRDLVRLTGHDPVAEISALFEGDEAAEGSQ